MATQKDYIDFLLEQLEGIGLLRAQKMFGEYMIYVDDCPILLVCDGQVYVKINEVTQPVMEDVYPKGSPYLGAKPHYMLNPDERESFRMLTQMIREQSSWVEYFSKKKK